MVREFFGGLDIAKKLTKKCHVCGRPVFSVHSIYCRFCARLAFRMKIRRFSPEAIEGVWDYVRTYDFRCYYTKMLLEMDDIKSPWYCVFDHLIPLDSSTIVLTSSLLNEMKTALSEGQFWFYVEQLDDFKHKNKKIRKIRLAYWRQQEALSKGKRPLEKKSPLALKAAATGKKCCICERPVFNIRSKYCLRCSHFNHRMELKGLTPQAIEEIREHLRTKGYVCSLTGVALDMADDRSPWYGVFNYYISGDKTKVMLISALFGEMKSDLSIDEFWYYIRQLANYKRYHVRIKKKKLRYWYRLTARKLRLKSLRD